MKKFKIGDVVQLASGGPKMKMNGAEHEGSTSIIECVWFAGDKFGRDKIDEGAGQGRRRSKSTRSKGAGNAPSMTLPRVIHPPTPHRCRYPGPRPVQSWPGPPETRSA